MINISIDTERSSKLRCVREIQNLCGWELKYNELNPSFLYRTFWTWEPKYTKGFEALTVVLDSTKLLQDRISGDEATRKKHYEGIDEHLKIDSAARVAVETCSSETIQVNRRNAACRKFVKYVNETIEMTTDDMLVLHPYIITHVSAKAKKDFTPTITTVVRTEEIVVNNRLPPTPASIECGSNDADSQSRLTGERFRTEDLEESCRKLYQDPMEKIKDIGFCLRCLFDSTTTLANDPSWAREKEDAENVEVFDFAFISKAERPLAITDSSEPSDSSDSASSRELGASSETPL
ncbi:hypothetical protein AYO20_08415 [Fonsecaea nubica]|uniref:Uncharacterized protein n=1 Tax=Fonsecaea nubica TaxID=856822 RepID=A0A178CP62_9EURO|nr:hypothetical protein AYO20_08415 [Fonsecaea nubica]OAL31084.1 hypothetical protein AYO20_08415 [Fonsecaea nubica]